MHHTMVMGTVIGGHIVQPTLTMVDPLITVVGTEVGVAGKAANKKRVKIWVFLFQTYDAEEVRKERQLYGGGVR
jgi:hypothetical protein